MPEDGLDPITFKMRLVVVPDAILSVLAFALILFWCLVWFACFVASMVMPLFVLFVFALVLCFMTSFSGALVVFLFTFFPFSCNLSFETRHWVFAHFVSSSCLHVFALFLKGSTWGLLPFCPRSVGEGVRYYAAKIRPSKCGVGGPCMLLLLRFGLLTPL